MPTVLLAGISSVEVAERVLAVGKFLSRTCVVRLASEERSTGRTAQEESLSACKDRTRRLPRCGRQCPRCFSLRFALRRARLLGMRRRRAADPWFARIDRIPSRPQRFPNANRGVVAGETHENQAWPIVKWLIDRIHNGMAKVVTGIRRCRKTYIGEAASKRPFASALSGYRPSAQVPLRVPNVGHAHACLAIPSNHPLGEAQQAVPRCSRLAEEPAPSGEKEPRHSSSGKGAAGHGFGCNYPMRMLRRGEAYPITERIARGVHRSSAAPSFREKGGGSSCLRSLQS